ncbi:hypothetical protein ACFFTN_21100 [Aminobacter aganoensis]|uniref:Uncharacterized protein n=1 Tax=Aminobacter aganoensis TaxID=83264 RepID=A0A7X0FC39_9HYPH|nr:hypothetical protein [Aminobacter aganoensis]MBB6356932.1 hypothetical protein [Aminobacter aganoensis]
MSAQVITDSIITKSDRLHALLIVCEQAARSLDNVGEGAYRDNVTASLADTMNLAASLSGEIHIALERTALK